MARVVRVEIVGDAKSFVRSMQVSAAEAQSFGGRLRGVGAAAGTIGGPMGKAASAAERGSGKFKSLVTMMSGMPPAAAGAVLGIALVAKGLEVSVHAAEEHEQVMTQVREGLKSTHDASKMTAEGMDGLADSIQNQTGISRDSVLGSEKLLLAFTHVRQEAGKGNNVFERATRVIQDYSVRTGKDATTATIAFGKALEDPAHKMGGLAKAGIVLDEQTQKNIKSMQESGNLMGAQKLLLAYLEERYKGAGQAAGEELGGGIDRLKGHFHDLEISIGEHVIPVLNSMVQGLNDAWPTISAGAGIALGFLKTQLDNAMLPMREIVDLIHGDWSKAWNDLKQPALDAIAAVRAPLDDLWPKIKDPLDNIADFFVKLPGRISNTLGSLTNEAIEPFKTAFRGAKTFVGDRVDDIHTFFVKLPNRIANTLDNLGSEAIAPFKGAFTGAKNWAGARVDDIHDFFVHLPARLAGTVGNLTASGLAPVKRAFSSFSSDVTGFVGDIGSAFRALPATIRGLADDAFSGAKHFATRIADGISAGLKAIAGYVADLIVAPINAVIGKINGIRIPGFHVPGLHFNTHIPGVGTVGFDGFDTPSIDPIPGDIPKLAAGGIVTRPTLALIGEAGPEAIVPLTGHHPPPGPGKGGVIPLDPRVPGIVQKIWSASAPYFPAGASFLMPAAQNMTISDAVPNPRSIVMTPAFLNLLALSPQARANRATTGLIESALIRDWAMAYQRADVFDNSGLSFGAADVFGKIVAPSVFSKLGILAGYIGGATDAQDAYAWGKGRGFILDGQFAKLAKGGIVTRPTIAMIGERGPEAVVPLSSGFGGGITVTLNINGGTFVGTEKRKFADDLVDEIESALIRKQRRNGGRLGFQQ
jgi:hypothetical protein